MTNSFFRFIFFIYILILFTIFLNGWSEHEYRNYLIKSGDTSQAVITQKNHIDNTYVLEYLYHDNVTEQGYVDFKIVSADFWNTFEVKDRLVVIYDQNHPTKNVFRETLITTSKWPIVKSLFLVCVLIIPILFFIR
ncbi:hypothetical protein [Candidatus Uabimicrobium sp. HlEnr_7]|uniref:hypothetical protein n=1 Tax=Candidatus Uabimicrobium helgolandensis TaxID=3095367 RepID=UPI0035588A4C